MKLYFDKTKVATILDAVAAGSGHVRPYTGEGWDDPEDNTPGIMLVGDRRYLIGNESIDRAPVDSGLIAYAGGCDPEKDSFWREIKRVSFGDDDGAEFLSLEEARKILLAGRRPFVEITPDKIAWGSEG